MPNSWVRTTLKNFISRGVSRTDSTLFSPKLFYVNTWNYLVGWRGWPLGAIHKLWHLSSGHSRNYEWENDKLMINFVVKGYFSSGSNFWCLWGEWFDFHCYISMVRISYSAVSVYSLLPPAPLSHTYSYIVVHSRT